MDLRWKHPFTAVVSGPTCCGKSDLLERLIANSSKVFDTNFKKVIWCYSLWHPNIRVPGVEYKKGVESLEELDNKEPVLIVLDDLMQEIDDSVVSLFTRGCHHQNRSVILITQNMFHQRRGQRDIALNTHYMILFRNPRDAAQVAFLARQVCPTNPNFLMDAYKDATSRPYGYLLCDFKQTTPENVRFRSNILSETEDGFPCAYVEKKRYGKRRKT
ncbi:hypothetical protein B566_EDAN008639 [Ephemera danica]|nr:hypothetical protein B566_EDAN008639 [Ephemera danica]